MQADIQTRSHSERGRRLAAVATLSLIVLGMLLRLRGAQVSFWMDEAWVANSLLSSSWHDVFFYPPWLQTSPPGFLVLATIAVDLLGSSHLAFRAVALLSAAVGLVAVAVVSRQVLSPFFALLPLTIVALSPTAIQYSQMVKQYSTEHAVGAVLLLAGWSYFSAPSSSRYWRLVASVVLGMLCAYGAVFAVGGVLLLLSPPALWAAGTSVNRRDLGRWLLLCGLAAVTLALEYVYFYLPNTSPALKEYWKLLSFNQQAEQPIQLLFRHLVVYARHAPLQPVLTSLSVVAGVALVLTGLLLGFLAGRGTADRRRAVALLCLAAIPAAVLIVSGLLHVYPNSARTSLVLLPGVVLLVGSGAQGCHEWIKARARETRALGFAAPLSSATWVVVGGLLLAGGTQLGAATPDPVEDYRSAVNLLRSSVSKNDVVYVHACCEEGFRLYRTIEHWQVEPEVMYGTTGQPCCPRRRVVEPFPSDQEVRNDVAGRLPAGFSGRVWLLYVDRADYWRNASGRNEAPLLTEGLRSVGCTLESNTAFRNMGVTLYDCATRRTASVAGDNR